jgi:hypothetical protein
MVGPLFDKMRRAPLLALRVLYVHGETPRNMSIYIFPKKFLICTKSSSKLYPPFSLRLRRIGSSRQPSCAEAHVKANFRSDEDMAMLRHVLGNP